MFDWSEVDAAVRRDQHGLCGRLKFAPGVVEYHFYKPGTSTLLAVELSSDEALAFIRGWDAAMKERDNS